MRLAALDMARIDVPFHLPFTHAAAERGRTESVWVEARSEAGTVGWGEACPRPYVTGEDTLSAAAFLARHRPGLRDAISGVDDVVRWARRHRADVDANPAAWCAIELALLDLLARERDVTVEALLGLPPLRGPFRYSAVLGDADPATFGALVARYRGLGFTDFKVKLSGRLARDRAKLACLADAGLPVRADANNLWRSLDEARAYLEALDAPLVALEEPLQAFRWHEQAALFRATGCPIVLDESLLRAEQLHQLPGSPAGWIVNARVSKLGGIVRSLALVGAARALGIGVIVGAHVGESSLLTRAALPVARHAGEALLAQEGAVGTWLLARDPCAPSLVFGPGGVLEWPAAAAVAGPPDLGTGFGLRPVEASAWRRPLA